jgi:hypothetical protein
MTHQQPGCPIEQGDPGAAKQHLPLACLSHLGKRFVRDGKETASDPRLPTVTAWIGVNNLVGTAAQALRSVVIG